MRTKSPVMRLWSPFSLISFEIESASTPYMTTSSIFLYLLGEFAPSRLFTFSRLVSCWVATESSW